MSVIETLAMTDLPVYVQNEMQACHNCGRIDFSSLQCLLPGSQVPQAELMHILDGWLQANSLSSSRRYYGVTRPPLVRMHTCRNGWPAEAGLRDAAGQDPERSHYPTRWSNMSVLFFGDRENILALERVAIRQHQALLSNSVSAAGTGTQQPLLFLRGMQPRTLLLMPVVQRWTRDGIWRGDVSRNVGRRLLDAARRSAPC